MKANKQIENILDFSVSGYKQMETHRGVAYSGNILYKGRKVGRFSNSGTGGCTWFDFDDDAAENLYASLANEHFADDSESGETLVLLLCNISDLRKLSNKKKYAGTNALFAIAETNDEASLLGEVYQVVAPTPQVMAEQLKEIKASRAIVTSQNGNIRFFGTFGFAEMRATV